MLIDSIKYPLSPENYVKDETYKQHIIIGNTFNHDMRHYIGWLHRYNGKYKKTAAFTIDAAGFIYNHFDPKYYSRFFNNKDFDKKIIMILLENDGWLIRNDKNDGFITWNGDIYNKPNEVVEKKWRGYTYWSPYNEKQFESAQYLVKVLCNKFNIPISAVEHNTIIDRKVEYEPILYRSNINKNFTDVNPSWDCEMFKNKIEINKTK